MADEVVVSAQHIRDISRARKAVSSSAQCEWFAMCDNLATGTIPHPVLGDVPICDRCRALTGKHQGK